MERIPAFDGSKMVTVESDGARVVFPPHQMQDPDGAVFTVLPARSLYFTGGETSDGVQHPAVRIDSFFANTSLLYVMSSAELRAVALSFNEVAQEMEDRASDMLNNALGKRGNQS
jgi:hypothetical protein